MDVILLERIEKLGQMGETVRVKDGFARNYLLPQKKALRANEANRKFFEDQRAELEALNRKRREEAEDLASKMNGLNLVMVRQAGESGQLYGSVTARDVGDVIRDEGFKIERQMVDLNQPIKALGLYPVRVALHPEVDVTVNAVIARSADDADRMIRGEKTAEEQMAADDAAELTPAEAEAEALEAQEAEAEAEAEATEDAPRA